MFVDDGESLHVCVMGVMRMLMTLCIRVVLAIHFPSSLHQDLNRHWATTFEEEEVRVLKPAAVLGARMEEHMSREMVMEVFWSGVCRPAVFLSLRV